MINLKKMSAALIPLSLMTMTDAFAENEIPDNSCSTTNYCQPCCVPQPKKCIDCECYNPQFYDLQCDWGVFASVDFLYWYARESNLEYANTIEYTPVPVGGPTIATLGYVTNHHYISSKWDAGVRVGLGMNSRCDGWDLFLNWTYLDNHHSGSKSAPTFNAATDFSEGGLINGVNDPWASPIDNAANGFVQVVAPQVSAKWSVIFNQIDLELGKKFWISKCFTLRPYTGLRGAWTHTNFHVVANNPSAFVDDAGTIFASADSNKFRNRFWGVGVLGGLQPQFVFGNWCGCGVFSLYGNLEGSLIWGKYRGHNALVHTVDATFITGTSELFSSTNPVEKDNFSRMQGILDLGIGIRWEDTWCCDRYMTSIDLGWEHHYWYDFGLYHRTIGGFSAATPATTPLASNNFVTNLGLGGLVVRFRFDF